MGYTALSKAPGAVGPVVGGGGYVAYGKLETPEKLVNGEYAIMLIDIVRFTKSGDNEQLNSLLKYSFKLSS